ncbi:MAG: M48 family metalloprotease, partial [Candidatus Zixiibacteriota bacterium]
VLMIIIVPVFISPLFNKFEPLEDKQLAAELTALAHRAGIENPDIYQVNGSKQSNKINAYFTGMFGTKRIVIYDTMLDNFTRDEILYVMGHEIGHYVKSHIWKGLFLAIFIIFIAAFLADKFLPKIIDKYRHKIGFATLGDIASFPLLILFITVFSFVVQPVQNGISRSYEYACDSYGLQISGVTDKVAVTAFDKLSVFNLADPDPSDIIEFWFYDHPALTKRMENVKTLYMEKQSNL